jgi:uncharacterized protein (TIGR02001 family)
MKSMITKTVVAGAVAALAGTASAEVSVTADFVSAYVFRGVTLLDGASFQPGIEASGFGLPEEYGAVSAGIWGSADLEGSNADTFQETDYYVSYSLPALVEGVDLFVGYTEYAYAANVSDKEFNAGVGFSVADVALGAAVYQGVGGEIDTQLYAEFSAGYDLEVSEDVAVSLGANVGYLHPESGESGFSHYDLTASTSFTLTDVWSIGAFGTYIGHIDEDVLGASYDVDFVGGLNLGAAF